VSGAPAIAGLRLDARFQALLGAHTIESIEAERGSVIGLWSDARIALLNSGWHRFAHENDGGAVLERWALGSDFFSGISGVLRDYYREGFARALGTGQPWEQSYECHSPATGRQFRLRALPLAQGALLLVHSLVVSDPAWFDGTHAPRPSELERYVGADGIIRQCCNCRRTQRVASPASWDWLPELVARPPGNVSHVICMTCMKQVYPDL
jgi:hypothetical protein